MRNLLLILFFVSFYSCTKQVKDSSSDFVLGKGTNLAHWLSQSTARGDARQFFIQENDLKFIANQGFQHVRLPIDEEQMWDEQGNKHEDAFALLDSCIQWSIKYNLCVIVDLHILRSHHFNAEIKPLWTDKNEQAKFLKLWSDLSLSLKKYPLSKVAYELMNEAVADDPEDWNILLAECYATIRKIEPFRILVIGSNRWQSVDTFDVLKVPDNDPNIILSFHFYEPFLLTHYKASWTVFKEYDGPVNYPGVILSDEEMALVSEQQKIIVQEWIGREFNIDILEQMMVKPIKKAEELGLRLYCGEFGVLYGAPEEDRLQWYRDMMEIFEKNNIGFANWNYKSDEFGLINNDNSLNEELIKIVSGKEN